MNAMGQRSRKVVRQLGYQTSPSDRIKGAALTGILYAAVVCGFFITIRTAVHVESRAPTLTVLEVHSVSEAREIMPDPPDDQSPIPPKKEGLRQPPATDEQAPSSQPPLKPVMPANSLPQAVASGPPDVAYLQKPVATPLLPSNQGQKTDTWESEVLARLIRYRRYPRMAEFRRQQGVPWIRFVLSREGKVISAQLEQSSGFPELDREAVALPKRAQPFPAPPANKLGDRFELIVPVEFFLAR